MGSGEKPFLEDAPPLPVTRLPAIPAPRPSLWDDLRRWGRWSAALFVRYNPAYILSAVLMIAGVYTIVEPGRQTLGNLPAILATFSVLEAYELVLVGIALYLVCLLDVTDDGATLVFIEAAFVIGCFIIADEVTFRDGTLRMGLGLGLIAAALAAFRFGLLGRMLGRPFVATGVGVLLLLLLLWNGAVPAGLACVQRADHPLSAAVCLGGWWVLTAVVLGLALLAARERDALWARDRAFIRAVAMKWMLVGALVVVTALHQYWMGYILDVGFTLSDILPLATVVCIGLVNLLSATGARPRWLEHAIAAVPVGLCLVALGLGEFEPVGAAATGGTMGLRSVGEHEMRTLTWPVAWLGVIALLTLLQAWRRWSPAFAHQAAGVALLALLFAPARFPDAIEANFHLFAVAVAVYAAANATIYCSPFWGLCALAIANAGLGRFWPTLAPRVGVAPAVLVVMLAGASCVGLWLAFRRRLTPWLAHAGAVMMLSSLVWATFDPATTAPGWVRMGCAAILAGVFALMGRSFRWLPYYGLSAASLGLIPVRAAGHSDVVRGSPIGWLLILAAFALLGLGVLVSIGKSAARRRVAQGPPLAPSP